MTKPTLNLLESEHGNAFELLPWFIMDTLEGAEHERVAAHVGACAACQREIAWQQQLRAAHDEAPTSHDVNVAFARMQQRLRAPHSPATTSRLGQRVRQAWMGWAIAAQFVVIAGLIVALMFAHRPLPTYHALGSPGVAQAAGRLVVVFAPQTTETEMRRILQNSATRIVDGPTVTGAYVIAVAPTNEQHALDTLRTERSVHLVQTLTLSEREP